MKKKTLSTRIVKKEQKNNQGNWIFVFFICFESLNEIELTATVVSTAATALNFTHFMEYFSVDAIAIFVLFFSNTE